MSTDVTQGAPSEQEQQKEGPQEPQTYHQIAAAHIDTLNEINRQLPKMLTYFATALTQLTNNPIRSGDQEQQEDNLQARQDAFRKYAIYVGLSVGVIREELTKQINDLEQHKVIPKSHAKFSVALRQGQQVDQATRDPESTVTNGGYGDFDVGVLNARASTGQVGGENVLDRVKSILEELGKRTNGSDDHEEMALDR
ncbi:hypothetical protein ACN47E_007099 [Coniothyrium glycines]